MSKILILHPRLDIPFKKIDEVIPEKNYRDLIPIRKHWENFYISLMNKHMKNGDTIAIIEKPLWAFDDSYLRSMEPHFDIIYIPHRREKDYTIQSEKFRFVMQTVFPDYFTVDKKGWGAELSYLPLDLNKSSNQDFYNYFKARGAINISKFSQPQKRKTFPYSNYILFVCQIPHDEVIRNYSKISVAEALEKTLKFGVENGKNVLVKGHPVNPASMEPLKDITNKYVSGTYIDNVSIHDAIHNSNEVVMVNSGVGFEAMLYNKRIFRFGDAEYNQVIPEFNEYNYYNYQFNFENYRKFIDSFFELAHK